jgi:hypothetical protein
MKNESEKIFLIIYFSLPRHRERSVAIHYKVALWIASPIRSGQAQARNDGEIAILLQ